MSIAWDTVYPKRSSFEITVIREILTVVSIAQILLFPACVALVLTFNFDRGMHALAVASLAETEYEL